MAGSIDKNVGLDRKLPLAIESDSGSRGRTPFRSPWTIPCSCIYIKPFATSPSYGTTLSLARNEGRRGLNRKLTSSRRFTSGYVFANWLMSPFGIHSDTIANWASVIITPRSGNTFWWRRAFQVMTSLQNLYVGYGQYVNEHTEIEIRSHPYDLRK